MKSFVREHVGLAIVPGITVRQELADGTLVRIPLTELSMPRRTLMVYRDQGYVSDSASELIKLVRNVQLGPGIRQRAGREGAEGEARQGRAAS